MVTHDMQAALKLCDRIALLGDGKIKAIDTPQNFQKSHNKLLNMVVGDSLSAGYGFPLQLGWVHLLRERLEAERPGQYRVVNASASGDTTGGGLARLPRLLAEHRPHIVLIELGGNDGMRGLPLEAIRANLLAMTEAVQ